MGEVIDLIFVRDELAEFCQIEFRDEDGVEEVEFAFAGGEESCEDADGLVAGFDFGG